METAYFYLHEKMNPSPFLSSKVVLRRLVGIALVLSTNLMTGFAMGQSDEAPSSSDIKRAADSYDQGRERFRDGDYTEAAEKFEAADDFAPSAAALRLAMAARKEAGQFARAATLAALALQRHGDEEDLRSEAEAIVSEVAADFAKVTITCDVGCELTLNNRLVHGRAAQDRIIYVEAGTVTIRASWPEGRTNSERLSLEAGDSKEVSFSAPAIIEEPTVPATEEEKPSFQSTSESDVPVEDKASTGWSPAVFWTGTALTVAGAGASVALGVRALNSPGKTAVRNGCEAKDTNCELYVEGRKNQTLANVAIGATSAVGVFTLITGIWLTNWGGKGDTKKHSSEYGSRLRVRPLISVGDGAFIGAEGSF